LLCQIEQNGELKMTVKKCIFCQGYGMSKEHFWPDWLNLYFNKTNNDKHVSALYSSEGKCPSILLRKNKRPGNLITKKLRVVCETCNNGWMSQLEEKVKSTLLGIIENKSVTLTEQDLLILSRWIVMKVIVAEQSEEGTQVTPEVDRKIFYENEKIPDYFRVYIARQKTTHESAYLRHSVTLASSPDGPSPSLNGMRRNTQTVGFLIGSLFVYVTAARVDNFNLEGKLNLKHLRCIYPNQGGEVIWNTVKELEQPEMSAIVWALDDLISSSSVKYGGPLKDQ
jgi:hypothetical protein